MSATPGEGVFCYIVGAILLALGGVAFAMSFKYTFPKDPGPIMAAGAALIFSSAIWFAIGRTLKILAQIERNTRK